MDSATFIDAIDEAIDTLIVASEPYEGLFPSMLDRHEGTMLRDVPPAIPGQREHDRAHHGTNLIHDEPVLQTMYALAEALDRPTYAAAADRYLETFATTCIAGDESHGPGGTATGLFPWGEHAYWHLLEDRVGNSREYGRDHPGPAIHDHLRLVPEWLWNRLIAANPACVHHFADGLAYHWNDPDAPEYIRHAYITVKDRNPTGGRSCDFPRHGGHYIHDWAVAYADEPHPEYLRHIRMMLDYWWDKREPGHGGLLPIESRGRTHELSGGQTLSLGNSLLDAAGILEGTDCDAGLLFDLQNRGETYVQSVLSLPHDYEEEVFVGTCRERDLIAGTFEPVLGTEYELSAQTTWVSAYGGGSPAAKAANQCLCAYRHTEDPDFLEHAVAVGGHYLDHPLPADGRIPFAETNLSMEPSTRKTMTEADAVPVRAANVGAVLALFGDLYDLTGEDRWLSAGLDLGGTAVEVFFDAPLPRAAAATDHYESQLGPGFLIHGLARIALLDQNGRSSALGPNYTYR